MYFYHVYGPLDNKNRICEALKKGLTIQTYSRSWGSGGGGALYPDVINQIKLEDHDSWMDFEIAFRVFLSPMSFNYYLRFTLSTNEVYVFNQDISTDLFGYVEEEGMGSEYEPGMFTDELPSKEVLMRQYWESRMTLEEYLNKKPYPKPEYLIFQAVPPNLLDGFTDNQLIR